MSRFTDLDLNQFARTAHQLNQMLANGKACTL